MALKRKIDEATWKKLSPDLQSEYIKGSGDDAESYLLQTEGDEDVGALKRAKDREKEAAKKLKEDLAKAKEEHEAVLAELEELRNAPAKKKGDVETLEASYKAKLAQAEKKSQERIEALEKSIRDTARESTARKLAADLAGDNADILLPHIEKRITVELEDGKPNVKVLDGTGAVSALTVEELSKEFLTDKRFGTVVVASKASGGGAGGGQKRSGGVKKLSEMSATEEAAFANSDPSGYAKMVAAESAAAS